MTPDNTGYFHAGYIVALGIYILYTASLWWRERKVEERIGTRDGGRGERGTRVA